MKGISLFCIILGTLSLLFNSHAYVQQASLRRVQAQTRTVLQSLGSDVLERPEDENSPEFKEYLRKLLQMQATRAKGGYAAPSSASADAYIAKLNRIKLERAAFKEAGLNEELVDLTYKSEDYTLASAEGADVSVSAGVLPQGASSGGGGKVRPLAAEEIGAAVAAAKAVEVIKRKLEAGEPLTQEEKENPAYTDVDATITREGMTPAAKVQASRAASNPYAKDLSEENTDSNSMNLIDKLLNKSGLNPNRSSAEAPKQKAQPPAQQRQQEKPAAKAPAAPAPAPAPAPMPVKASTPSAPAPSSRPASSKKKAPKGDELRMAPRKLNLDEMDTAASAMQLLVKHRGGGQFGFGRLEGGEVKTLENALRNVVQMLNADTNTAVSEGAKLPAEGLQESAEDPKKRRRDPELVLPSIPKKKTVEKEEAAAPAQVEASAPIARDPLPVEPPREVPVPVQSAPLQPVMQEAPPASAAPVPPMGLPPVQPGQPIPIAVGLDRFLQAPKATSMEELSGLRDALIECLGMLSAEIREKEMLGQGMMPPAGMPMPQAPAQPASGAQAAPPQMMQPPAPASPPQADPRPLQQPQNLQGEAKQALGLLLKHRGGPGFGHGRLQGKELSILEERLRSVSKKLLEEANA